MESSDELFDDANGDLAVGDLESAVEKYRRCIQLDPDFSMAGTPWHALMKIGRFQRQSKQETSSCVTPNDQIGWTSSLFYNRAGTSGSEAAGAKA
jgi:hypothetical protein